MHAVSCFPFELAVWDSLCPPNILIAMKDTWGRTQQLEQVSMHLVYISRLLEITFSGIPSS